MIEKQPLNTIIMAHKSAIGPKHNMHHASTELVSRAWSATTGVGKSKRGIEESSPPDVNQNGLEPVGEVEHLQKERDLGTDKQ